MGRSTGSKDNKLSTSFTSSKFYLGDSPGKLLEFRGKDPNFMMRGVKGFPIDKSTLDTRSIEETTSREEGKFTRHFDILKEVRERLFEAPYRDKEVVQ